ncbi:GbsR/MarR family transcriptional regulator [Streptomyces sp. NPDC056835]|uniref:GbsR/MarR family transcriptional regulator n=1 Tax=Streptomyces sp. NPDC056835 TaxID=3345956 RepID=UPI0036C36862
MSSEDQSREGRRRGANGSESVGGSAGEDGTRRDEEAVSRFVERFAADMTEAGMQRTASRVFAALLTSDDASMTSAELSEKLRISPAAVSGAVRYLTQVSMVGRERDPGSRRDRYRLHDQGWYVTITQRDSVLSRWENTLRAGAETLGRDTPAGARVAETVEFFEFLQQELLALMDRWKDYQETKRVEEAEGVPARGDRA